jgi:hypothetical protein
MHGATPLRGCVAAAGGSAVVVPLDPARTLVTMHASIFCPNC